MTIKQNVTTISVIAVMVQGLIAVVTNSLRVCFGLFGPYAVTGMLAIYYEDATRTLEGQVPYRDFLVEYPVLALGLFLVPRLFVSDRAGYRVGFGVQLLLFNALAVFLVARRIMREEGAGRVAPRLVWYTAFFASLCPLLMGPYDLAPMALAFAAACFWFEGSFVPGGVLAGLGVLLKIFPGAVAAPALVWEAARLGRSRGRGTLAFLTTCAAGLAFWIWLGGRGVANSFRYHAERGLGIESLYAGILLLAGKARGERVSWTLDHSAIHVAPEWGNRLATLALPLQLATILLVVWCYARSGMKDGVRYAGASVLAFLITGKVLSPQFLIWMIPFVTVLGGETGRRARWTFLMACIATTILYPLYALKLVLEFNDLGGILLLNYRNALLLGLLGLLLFSREPESAGPPGEPPAPPAGRPQEE